MPGMMDTVLNLGINDETETALAEECGDAAFARNTHQRFLDLYAHIVLKAHPAPPDQCGDPGTWRTAVHDATGLDIPYDAKAQLRGERAPTPPTMPKRSPGGPGEPYSNHGTPAAPGAIANTAASPTISGQR